MSEAVTEDKKKKKPCCQKNKKLIKISDLPLYGNPYPRCDRVQSQDLGYIESGVKAVREELTPYLSIVTKGSERVGQILTTAYYHSKSTYESISSEGNTVGKAAAITGGGLIGLILASRKGFFKKILYSGAGLTAASAACYPRESKELSEIGVFIVSTKGPEIVKQYTGIDLSRKKEIKPKTIDTIGREPSNSEPKPNPSATGKGKPEAKVDLGMGRKEDQDLYANRSSK